MSKNVTIGINAIVIKKAMEYINWENAIKENDDYQNYYMVYIKKALYSNVNEFISKKLYISNYTKDSNINLIVRFIKSKKEIVIEYNTKCNAEFYIDYKNILKDQLYLRYDNLVSNICSDYLLIYRHDLLEKELWYFDIYY
jgi:hypothetical protein